MLAVAGILIAVLGGGTAAVAIGVFVTGVAAVGGVSLAFFAVGESEDREREREDRDVK